MDKKCKICDKKFKVFPYRVNAKFCSEKCFGKSIRKVKYIEDNTCAICDKPIIGFRKYCSKKCLHIGQIKGITKKKRTYLKCKSCGGEFYSGRLKSKFCSRECYFKWFRGKNSSNWQGGKSKEYDIFRNGKEFKDWRKQVFERDNYTCQDCEFKNGKGIKHRDLHPHHIKSASKYIDLRLDIDNGVTLCLNCHGRRHSINFKNKKYKKK